MKKFFLLILLLLIANIASANDNGYVSPESYAINEADMVDYFDVPAPRRLNIDELDKPLKLNKTSPEKTETSSSASHKVKRAKGEKKPYEERIIYKAAKWWTTQTYKFDDPHHGEKHEIKIKAREEYEKQQAEKTNQSKSNNY